MTWQKRHDIILNWIDSCVTFKQLENMIYFVKKQDFDTEDLIFYCGLKSKQIYLNGIVSTLEKLVKCVK